MPIMEGGVGWIWRLWPGLDTQFDQRFMILGLSEDVLEESYHFLRVGVLPDVVGVGLRREFIAH